MMGIKCDASLGVSLGFHAGIYFIGGTVNDDDVDDDAAEVEDIDGVTADSDDGIVVGTGGSICGCFELE